MPEQYTSEIEQMIISKNQRNVIVNESIVENVNPITGLIAQDSMTDAFRSDVMSYWKWNKNIGAQKYNVPLHLFRTPQIETNQSKEKVLRFLSADLGTKISLLKLEETTDQSIPGYKKEVYEVFIDESEETIIKNSPKLEEKPGWWTNWCLSKFSKGGTNLDMSFSFNKPETGLKDTSIGSAVQKNFVKIKGNYNYLSLGYEKLISGLSDKVIDGDPQVFNERVLPNLYTYMTFVKHNMNLNNAALQEKNTPTGNQLEVFKNHLTLNGLMENFDVNGLFFKEVEPWYSPAVTENKFDLANNSINNYINLWTEAAAFRNKMHMQGDSFLEEAQVGYDKILFSQGDFKIINNYNSAASMFPMNIQVQIETEQNKSVFLALKDTKYNSLMLRFLADPNTEGSFSSYASNETKTMNLQYSARSFTEFLNDAKDGTLVKEEASQTDYVYIGTDTDQYDFSAPQNSFFSKLMSLGLDAKITSLVNSTARSFEQILSGDECYSETVAYEIEKWSAGGGGQLLDKIQTFYLPNDQTSMLEMFDTQVKYNKFYVYRIFAHKVVFGTQYVYSAGKESIYDKANKKSALITVTSSPTMNILRVPYYNVDEAQLEVTGPNTGVFLQPSHLTTLVMDEAPLPPEIEMVPMIKTPNTILINIKDTIGSMRQLARPIEDNDVNQYEVLLEKQLKDNFNLSAEELANIDLFSNEVFFKSDEPSQYLQIFQSTVKPTNYSYFKDSEKQLLNGPNNSVRMNLNFNQKYYFVFRAIDFHGKFSNPTDVYEVEIKEEDGMWFPVFRVFNIEEENKLGYVSKQKQNTNFSITGKKFIHIKPSYHQWMMKEKYDEEDYDSASDIPDFSIGEAEQSVFQENRKFKIRLTSKKTGRKIDLNVRFKQRQEKLH